MSGPAPSHGRQVEFRSVLGKGGFGAVYLADLHGRDGFVQRVAIKVLNETMSASADIAARQRDEARLLARLNHDHIVKVYDLCEVHGRPAVIMEHIQGVDMADVHRKGPLPLRAALQAIASAGSALDAAWRTPDPQTGRPLRVVHRDIKPSNLLLSQHGALKVLDFGIARGDFDREGATGSVQFGTTRFMAPEQWLSHRITDKVDVYALGVTLIDLLAGASLARAPLDPPRFSNHMQTAIESVIGDELPGVLAARLRDLLERMLAYDASDRPSAADVHEISMELADELRGESLGRFARRVVPPLLQARASAHAHTPVPASVRIDTPATAGATVPIPPASSGSGPTHPWLRPPEPPPPDVPQAGTIPYRKMQKLLDQRTATVDEQSARPPGRSRSVGRLLVGLAVAALVPAALIPTVQVPTVLLGTRTEPLTSPAAPTGPTAPPTVNADPLRATQIPPVSEESDPPPPAEVAVPTPRAEPLPAPRPPAETPQSVSAPIPPSTTARPTAAPTPAPRAQLPASEPAPAPEATRPPLSAPSLQTYPLSLSSSPLGARVEINGKPVSGTTPLSVELPTGPHKVRIHDASGSCQGTVMVNALAAASYRCITATAALEALR